MICAYFEGRNGISNDPFGVWFLHVIDRDLLWYVWMLDLADPPEEHKYLGADFGCKIFS